MNRHFTDQLLCESNVIFDARKVFNINPNLEINTEEGDETTTTDDAIEID